jgi:Fic family protein
MGQYIWQNTDWPRFTWNADKVRTVSADAELRQSRLFPSGMSGGYKITTGKYRLDEYGPMHVVSGTMGNETVHYTAPPATILEEEMNRFFGCRRVSSVHFFLFYIRKRGFPIWSFRKYSKQN